MCAITTRMMQTPFVKSTKSIRLFLSSPIPDVCVVGLTKILNITENKERRVKNTWFHSSLFVLFLLKVTGGCYFSGFLPVCFTNSLIFSFRLSAFISCSSVYIVLYVLCFFGLFVTSQFNILGLSENFLSICNLFPYSFRLTSRKQ